jgi:hypothetical protein
MSAQTAATGGPEVGHGEARTCQRNLPGQVTYTGESTVGWDQAGSTPLIVITANKMYVASYFAPNSHYVSSSGMLRMLASTNALLYALLYALQMGARGNSLYQHFGSPMC